MFFLLFFFNIWEAWDQDGNKITWVLLFSDVIQLQKLHIMFVSFHQQKWIFLLLSLTKDQIFDQNLLEIVKTTSFFYFKKTQLGWQQILNFFQVYFCVFNTIWPNIKVLFTFFRNWEKLMCYSNEIKCIRMKSQKSVSLNLFVYLYDIQTLIWCLTTRMTSAWR